MTRKIMQILPVQYVWSVVSLNANKPEGQWICTNHIQVNWMTRNSRTQNLTTVIATAVLNIGVVNVPLITTFCTIACLRKSYTEHVKTPAVIDFSEHKTQIIYLICSTRSNAKQNLYTKYSFSTLQFLVLKYRTHLIDLTLNIACPKLIVSLDVCLSNL